MLKYNSQEVIDNRHRSIADIATLLDVDITGIINSDDIVDLKRLLMTQHPVIALKSLFKFEETEE